LTRLRLKSSDLAIYWK